MIFLGIVVKVVALILTFLVGVLFGMLIVLKAGSSKMDSGINFEDRDQNKKDHNNV